MTTLREAAQMALDAMLNFPDDISDDMFESIKALRAALANEFNPDWDAMAVMVEEQQRMAKRIEELKERLLQVELNPPTARLAQPEQEPVWGDSQVTKPEIVAEQKAMNESLRKMVEQEPPQQPELVIQARKEGNLIVVDLPQVPRGSGGITKDEQPEPRREWMGLTHEELEFYTEELGQGELGRGVLRAVVDFLKEKNT